MSVNDFQRLTNKPATVEGVRLWFEESELLVPARLQESSCGLLEAVQLWAASTSMQDVKQRTAVPSARDHRAAAVVVTLPPSRHADRVSVSAPLLQQQHQARTQQRVVTEEPQLDAPKRVFASGAQLVHELSRSTLSHFPPAKATVYLKSRARGAVPTAAFVCTCTAAGGADCACFEPNTETQFLICPCVDNVALYGKHQFANHTELCRAMWTQPLQRVYRLCQKGDFPPDMLALVQDIALLKSLGVS